MKHLFSFLTLGMMASLAWAQTDTYLYLQINAEGAADEDIVVVTLETQPAMLDGTATLTLMGDSEQLVMFGVPMGTMQGTVTASFVDCQGDSLVAETFMAYTGADNTGMTLLWAELELHIATRKKKSSKVGTKTLTSTPWKPTSTACAAKCLTPTRGCTVDSSNPLWIA